MEIKGLSSGDTAAACEEKGRDAGMGVRFLLHCSCWTWVQSTDVQAAAFLTSSYSFILRHAEISRIGKTYDAKIETSSQGVS
eukprot:2980726-Rhodomonas_salina.1